MKKFKFNLFTFGKKRTRVVSALCVATLALLCAFPAAKNEAYGATYLDSITSDSIAMKQAEIDKAKKQKAEIQGLKSNVESIKKSLEQKKKDLAAYIEQLDAELEQMQYNIMDLSDQIMIKEADIARTEEELEDARKQEQARYDAMVVRMRLMYETNNTNILTSLLGSTGLRDLLNRMDYIEAVTSYDQTAYNRLQDVRKYVELCEQELEIEKTSLDDALKAQEDEEAAMEELIEEKNSLMAEYVAEISATQKEINQYDAKIGDVDDEIALLEQIILIERQQIYASMVGSGSYTGGFVFPVASYKYVSSKYGNRIHPIYGTQKFHSGVDLAAAYGTAIFAAAGGVVEGAAYNSSMGNYVMINHGGGLYTVYMHASSLAVSAGEMVSPGQTIAYVGSTGASTGNHLHFSVRLNGNYVDPNDYIKFY